MKITVGKLRNLLSDIQERLEDFEDSKELELQGNTYFTRGHEYVLETPQGFLGLDSFDNDDDDEADGEEDAE